MSEKTDNYAVFKKPYHCDHCGWNRIGKPMSRELALIATALNRKQSSHHGWMARKIAP